ncbi:hypothetical protein GCM10008019_27460 [Deinococcus soli (ex Cha et al. 2016)]|nr:hypothetical protein GCM10008019_27460 [Deinococcus soli (ex Cha et al. 2016)]
MTDRDGIPSAGIDMGSGVLLSGETTDSATLPVSACAWTSRCADALKVSGYALDPLPRRVPHCASGVDPQEYRAQRPVSEPVTVRVGR